ncbi:MAG: hypothetical protein V8Q23_10450 [Eubacteriales bacterium]
MMRWINRRCANRPPGEDTERLHACLVLIIGGISCYADESHACKSGWRREKPPVTATAPQEYATTDELAAALSFPLALPQTLPDGYAFDSASDQFGMAVVVYADAEGHTLKYCMGKGEDALTGMNHTVSGEKLEGTDALLYAETGYTAVEWKDSKYSYCFIADESFDTTVWQALVNSIK